MLSAIKVIGACLIVLTAVYGLIAVALMLLVRIKNLFEIPGGQAVSQQSRPVRDRTTLEERLRELEDKYEGREVPRPPFWGGYRVEPEAIEFWQGRENRLHDRLLYRRERDQSWSIERLQP